MGTRGCVRLAEGKVDSVAFWAVFEVVAVMVSSESQVVKRVIFNQACQGNLAQSCRICFRKMYLATFEYYVYGREP